jgi:D-glycero-D-manno-heptose 1,7-bisphosphate phosphatase
MGVAQKALFLDRDGVINEDTGFVHRIEEFRFLAGIFDLCRAAKDLGFRLIVVTNQSGVGTGRFAETDFHTLTAWMEEQFRDRGVALDRVYHCPHHPTKGIGDYRKDCGWRKPKPGMLLRAARDFGLDLGASALIGDNARDIAAGRAAGLGLNLLYNGDGAATGDAGSDAVCRDFTEAVAELRGFAARGDNLRR